MESGGSPIRALVTTTWRSGSTFLGDILLSHPATYYHYEPLLHFGIEQVRNGRKAREALRVIKSLFNCDYSKLGKWQLGIHRKKEMDVNSNAYEPSRIFLICNQWRTRSKHLFAPVPFLKLRAKVNRNFCFIYYSAVDIQLEICYCQQASTNIIIFFLCTGAYTNYGIEHNYLFTHNFPLWRRCQQFDKSLCWNPDFLTR